MKKIIVTGIVALAAAAALSAQVPFGYGRGPMMGGYGAAPGAAQAAPTAKTVEGKLVFVDKVPAVQAKDKTYLIHMPGFYFNAYNDGIKEGAAVKVDGYELPTLPGQDKPYFQVTKAVINGKTYDFTTQPAGRGMMGGASGPQGGRGGMMGGRGGRGGMMGGRW